MPILVASLFSGRKIAYLRVMRRYGIMKMFPMLVLATVPSCVDEFAEPSETELSTNESELAAACRVTGPSSAELRLSAVYNGNPAFRAVDLRMYSINGQLLCSSAGAHSFSVRLRQGEYRTSAFVGGQRCVSRSLVIRPGTTNRVALDIGHC